jgi:hypothetical protein
MDEKKIIILVQGHECLYNLQHKDYDNNLVKDSFWKEIAGELHKGHITVGERQCSGRGTAWEQHGMCESAFSPLTPNGNYSGRTALLISRRCILNIDSTNIRNEYFKHAA